MSITKIDRIVILEVWVTHIMACISAVIDPTILESPCNGLQGPGVRWAPEVTLFEVWASEVHQSFVILNSQSFLNFGVLLSNYLP